MNYLAHIFLSGNDLDIQMGNFMGDEIKGRQYKKFSVQVQKGIILHRYIDSFTDRHILVKRSKDRLSKNFGHYGGVLIDIFYDHFLSNNWQIYSTKSLQDFVTDFYKTLEEKKLILPAETKRIGQQLVTHNWLLKYRATEDLEQVLYGMEKRIKHEIPLHLSLLDLDRNYQELENDFLEFFPLLQRYSTEILQTLDQQYEI
jgi:acyl carrier protein phosphodiesterase